jgi:CRP/FNR family transcriptional regulator, cyclic AMP receptor protein
MTIASSPSAAPGRLAATWFGERMPEAPRSRIERHARLVTYAPDAVILREGEMTQDLAIIASGLVAMRLRVPERGPTTIVTFEAGDVIGWSAVVPPHRATSTLIALTSTELILIDGDELSADMATDAELAAAVYSALIEAIARRLTATRRQLLDLFAQPVFEPW